MKITEVFYNLIEKKRSGRVLVVDPTDDAEAFAKARVEIEKAHAGHAYEIEEPLFSHNRLEFKDGICHDWGWTL